MSKRDTSTQKVPAGLREKIPFWFRFAWSSRNIALTTCTVLFAYVTMYCTDVLKMDPVLVGILLMVSKVFDGITDLVVGFLIDKTRTPLGKARPYEFAVIFLWIFAVMMFSTPQMGTVGTAVWVFIMYTMVNSIWVTILYGNEVAYLNRAVKSQENKISMTASNGIFLVVFGAITGVLIPQAVKYAGVSHSAWSRISIIIAVPMVILGLCRFLFVKEVIVDDSRQQPINLKEGFSSVKKNKYIWIFSAVYFCYHMLGNITGGASTYYFKYVVGDIGKMSIISLSSLISPIFLLIIPKLMDKYGTGRMLRIGMLCLGITPLIRGLFGTNMITLFLGGIFIMAGSVPVALMLNVYLFECIDYGEWKAGNRIEAMLNGITSFIAKIASALASAGIGFLMGAVGYSGDLEAITGSMSTMIIWLYNYIPAILGFIGYGLSFFYDLEGKLPQIRAELSAKHLADAPAKLEE